MIHYWTGQLSKYDLMVITRSPVVHLLYRINYPDLLDAKLRKAGPVEQLEDGPGIQTTIKNMAKVSGVLFIKTTQKMNRPFLMETSARLKCSVVVLHQKKS
jgi:hypothetical protein